MVVSQALCFAYIWQDVLGIICSMFINVLVKVNIFSLICIWPKLSYTNLLCGCSFFWFYNVYANRELITSTLIYCRSRNKEGEHIVKSRTDIVPVAGWVEVLVLSFRTAASQGFFCHTLVSFKTIFTWTSGGWCVVWVTHITKHNK